MTKLIPKEIYLLELFSSPTYLAELRDTWGDMVQHLEHCLDHFMRNLPSNYRRRPLPEQPDIVWGERVLPNFRSTFQSLCDGVISLSHGDAKALSCANGPMNDHKGQAEYSAEWLGEKDFALYYERLDKAYQMAANICATANCYWRPGGLGDPRIVGAAINLPADLPHYQPVELSKVATGAPVKTAGVYLPDVDSSCPEYLSPHKVAPNAIVLKGVEDLLHPSTGAKYGEKPVFQQVPCIWTQIERTGFNHRPGSTSLVHAEVHRTPGGHACTASGYYFTPSHAGSRRYFEKGTLMPTFDSSYGATIWQWDEQQ